VNVREKLRALGRGECTFDQVKAEFERATFTVRQPTQGDWGAVWARAEEVDDTDVPEVIAGAEFARQITKEQGAELRQIYVRSVKGR
jgi:predicted membrane-bound spermidine synthase